MASDESLATRAGQKADEWAEDYGDLLGVVPYADQVVAAYRLVRSRRVRSFLIGLEAAVTAQSDDARARFQGYIDSPTGRALLADFVEFALRARTRTAIAAVALLYADHDAERHSGEFKSSALEALEALSDRHIDAFLLLLAHQEALSKTGDEGPYQVLALRADVVAGNPHLSAWSLDGQRWLTAVADLVARDLMLQDWAAGSRLGDGKWVTYFGFSEDSLKFHRLLVEARALVGTSA